MDYLDAAIKSSTQPSSGNFQPEANRILSVDLSKAKELPEEIQIMSTELPEVNLPGIPNVKELGKEAINKSELNTILNYENFQFMINKINIKNKEEYGNNWIGTPLEKTFFHSELLGISYRISTLIINGRISGSTQWDLIQEEMVNIFKILLSLTIKHGNEVPLYSILTAQQTIFDNASPGTKIEIFEKTFWEMFLIPLMLKQDQLLGIKFMEFWMYLGLDFTALFDIIIKES